MNFKIIDIPNFEISLTKKGVKGVNKQHKIWYLLKKNVNVDFFQGTKNNHTLPSCYNTRKVKDVDLKYLKKFEDNLIHFFATVTLSLIHI